MPKTILAGVDFTPLGERALAAAASAADRLDASRLHIAHVMQASPTWALPLHEGLALAWQTSVDEVEQQLRALPVPKTRATITKKTLLGGAAYELAREARDIGADLIVVATHKRGAFGRWILGSVAASLIRNASCPVLVCGEDRPATGPMRRVLAAIDLSPISERILHEAVAFARGDQGLVHALSLFEMPTVVRDEAVFARFLTPKETTEFPEIHKRKVRELADRVRDPNVEIVADVMNETTTASRAILDIAQQTSPDLIVVGTSGHNAIERAYLGSTASPVIADAPCPVLVVPRSP